MPEIDNTEVDIYEIPNYIQVIMRNHIKPENVAYVGDDLPDLPVIRYVGFGAAVANAVDEVKKEADFVTVKSGGSGAVREVIEHILKKSGRWEKLIRRYLL